jgi:hypothetical protein
MRCLQWFFIRLVNTLTGQRDDARLNDDIEEIWLSGLREIFVSSVLILFSDSF